MVDYSNYKTDNPLMKKALRRYTFLLGQRNALRDMGIVDENVEKSVRYCENMLAHLMEQQEQGEGNSL